MRIRALAGAIQGKLEKDPENKGVREILELVRMMVEEECE